jgi:hypothetical protein
LSVISSHSFPGAPTDFSASFFPLYHAVSIISPLYVFILYSSYKKRKKDFLQQLCIHQFGTGAPVPSLWDIFLCAVHTGHVYAQYNHPPMHDRSCPLKVWVLLYLSSASCFFSRIFLSGMPPGVYTEGVNLFAYRP